MRGAGPRGPILAVVALGAALAGCADEGFAIDVTVEPGCVLSATDLEVDVTLTPAVASTAPLHLDAAAFFAGDHRIVILPPAGASLVTVTVIGSASGVELGRGTTSVTVSGARVDRERISLTNASCETGVDAGLSSPDLSSPDLSSPDLPPGVCPPVAPAAIHFVDPQSGADQPDRGGGLGTCAFQTLAYALTQATGVISLAAGSYTGPTITLTGQQQLMCNGAVLSFGGGAAIVVLLNGTANTLDGCVIRATGASTGVLVDVLNTGHHTVENCDISGFALEGVEIPGSASLTASHNFIHDSTATAIAGVYISTAGTVSLLGNMFANDQPLDILCTLPTLSVSGSGNSDGNGAASCSACAACPF